jgi:hypothetical protein
MRQDNLHLLIEEWKILNNERKQLHRNETGDVDRKMVNLEEIINREIVNHPEARDTYEDILNEFLTSKE